MTTLANDVLELGKLLDRLFFAMPNTVFAKRMAKTWVSSTETRRIDGIITSVMSNSANTSELWHWWPSTTLGWPSRNDTELTRDLRARWGGFEIYIADPLLVERAQREMRDRVVKAALAKVGSNAWSGPATNGVFGPGTNKCMLFVHDVVLEAGSDVGLPHGIRHKSPPTAGDWATAGTFVSGWRPLLGSESAEPGDVVAQAANYSDATGHVMTVGPAAAGGAGLTFIGTSDAPGVIPPGQVVQMPAKADIVDATVKVGPELFRRWDPLAR